MDYDEMIAHLLRMDQDSRKKAEEYVNSEPLIERVARLPISQSINIGAEAIHEFEDGETYEGYAEIVWDGTTLSAVFLSEKSGPAGQVHADPNPANKAQVRPKKGTWRLGVALIDERSVSAKRSRDTVELAIRDELIAGQFEVTESTDNPAFCRITYRGGNFNGYPHQSYSNIDGPLLQYDCIRLRIWDRDARLRSVSNGRNDEAKMFTVTYAGARLDAAHERSLFLLLSFLTGPQLEIVSYEEFDDRQNRRRLIVPAGTPFTSGGEPVIPTAGKAGEALATAFTQVLADLHKKLEEGFPWHVCFRHLHESYTPLLESAVKNLVIALDSLIEASVEDRSKSRFINKGEYRQLIEPMIETVQRASSERGYSDEFVKHMDRVLRTENHPGTAEKRRDFWAHVGINPDAYEDVLEYRDPAVHTGHVLDYLKPIDYPKFHGQVKRLRTIVNRAFLRVLGYAGPLVDAENGATIDVETGGAWHP